jgi:hypothetical protein
VFKFLGRGRDTHVSPYYTMHRTGKHKAAKMICARCGKECQRVTYWQRYCSQDCQQKANQDRMKRLRARDRELQDRKEPTHDDDERAQPQQRPGSAAGQDQAIPCRQRRPARRSRPKP